MPRMPSSSSVASSSAHWVSRPPEPTWLPICSAIATSGAYRTTPKVVSTSENPRSDASAASHATCSGLSRALVQCAWFAGVRRARIFWMPIMISTMLRFLATSSSLAGVSPPVTAITSSRVTRGSTSMRAISTAGRAIDCSVVATSMAWSAMNWSMKSKSARARPSISTITPFSTRTLGSGSNALSIATMPTSGHSWTKPSRLTGRSSRSLVRSDWRLASVPRFLAVVTGVSYSLVARMSRRS